MVHLVALAEDNPSQEVKGVAAGRTDSSRCLRYECPPTCAWSADSSQGAGRGEIGNRQVFNATNFGYRRVLATGYSQEIAETGTGGRPVILKPYRLATLAEAISDALQASK